MPLRYASRNLSSPIKANLHFSLSRSGTFTLDRADAVIEITEWVEVPRKNLTVDNSTSSTTNSSLETGPKTASEDNKVDDGIGNTSNSTTRDNDVEADLGMEKKLKKRTFRVPLKVLKLLSICPYTLFSFLESGSAWL